MKIGALEIDSPFWIAPMAGYSDAAFRETCREFGGGLAYTEVAVAQGLMRDSKPSWHLLETYKHEPLIAGHIYGSEPDVMAETARRIEATGRFHAIDINCGCPVRKIVAKGAGAALIRDPALIGRIVAAVRSAVSLPVLVKTRIGFEIDVPRIEEIAAQVEGNGADALAIHGRYANRHHKGPVDWKLIEQIKRQCQIPVLGNGGLFTPEDAVMAIREQGLDGVLIARGAVGNPWLFEDAARVMAGDEPLPRDYDELRRVVRLHLSRLVALKEREAGCRRKRGFDVDRGAALHFRCHFVQYLSGMAHWADIRRGLSQMDTTERILEALDMVIDRQEGPWRGKSEAVRYG